jgi:MinD-like ATPase involved in chromosome partitioning or flagellar assembly
MGKIVATHSFRGGTGKSNVTANLAALTCRAGHRVGVIDTDIQSPGIHVIFALQAESVQHCLNDYLWQRCSIEEAAHDVTAAAVGDFDPAADRPRLFLIPSSIKTGEIARVLREGYDVGRLTDGLRTLLDVLRLDYLFIDTHPGVNEETLLSIALCDRFLLILRPDNQDFQGTAVTVELARRLDVRDMLLVLNKVPAGMDRELLCEQIEGAYRAPVAAVLPLAAEVAQLASSGLFALRHPDHPWTRELMRVAQRIVA